MTENQMNKLAEVGSVFTPGAPVSEKDLFAGRLDQLDQVISAATQRGYHAILYGERGVGKTSLANIIANGLQASGGWVVPRVNCDGTDTFSSLWRKALQDIALTKSRPGMGFGASEITEVESAIAQLPETVSPDDVRRALQSLSGLARMLIAFDEFDRLHDKHVTTLMADTIKTLSDYAVPATILMIGVAGSVDELIDGHQSVERALVQIPMPRMSGAEIRQIVTNGVNRLSMGIDEAALTELTSLSQGLPYITHLLALNSTKNTVRNDRTNISSADVDEGIKQSLGQWQQSVVKAYYDATQSSQPGNIYKPVLLACALAETDDLGYFSAAAVRAPLRIITERDYDIPNFAQHLKNFGDEGRGGMIERTGETRRIRYRFTSPLMRPYIIMRGFTDGLITRRQMQKLIG